MVLIMSDSALILSGDFYTGAVLASTLTKLILRYSQTAPDLQKSNALRAEVRILYKSVAGNSKALLGCL